MTGIRIVPAGAPLYVGAIPPGIQVAQSGSVASPLLTDLVAYYKLDETSGTRFDSVGANNLSDFNTVGFAIGKIGNAADFVEANNEYLSIASNTDLQLNSGSWTIAFWVKTPTIAGIQTLVSKWSNIKREYIIYTSGGQVLLGIGKGDNSGGSFQTNGANHGDDIWTFIVVWYDAVASKSYIQLDNGSIAEHTVPLTPGNSNNDFRIGGDNDNDGRFTGLIDEAGIWHRTLTAPERSQLYNGGSGITYPFV
jgi:hypothetical protein